MHAEPKIGLQDSLNIIASFATGYHLDWQGPLNSAISSSLEKLGTGGHFATLIVNNFNIVQKANSSFTDHTAFFGRDLRNIISLEILTECNKSHGPIYRNCGGLLLSSPFDKVYDNSIENSHFGVFPIFRGRFIQGYFVIFGENVAKLESMSWPACTVAQLAVDAIRNLPQQSEGTTQELNPKEILALRWTYEGKTSKEVAAVVGNGWTKRTVDFHTARAMEKLSAQNKQAAAKIAKEMGLF